MNETRIEKVALAFVAVGYLIFSGAVTVSIIYLVMALSSWVWVRPAFAQSNTAGVRLEAGIEREEVDGDLKSAMEIYQKIAADSSAPRDVRSKALLRLAGCYEKLGRQAGQVYEQIVRDFADQPAAAQARSRLAALKQEEHPAPPRTMSVRKIEWSAVGNLEASDTDGEHAIYEGSAGNLFYGDLAGHAKRMYFKAEPGTTGSIPSRDFSMASLIFPAKPNRPGTLAVVKTDGTGYRELVRDDSQGTILGSSGNWFAYWSWDNRYLVVRSNREKGGGHLLLVCVADGQRRELVSIEKGYFTKAMFSPDGHFIAYEVAPLPGEGETSHVFIVPVQGGEPHRVYESVPKPSQSRPGLEHWTLLDWTADGRYLAIADAPRGKAALYLLPIKNGAAAGASVFVRYGDFEEGYMTAGGALVYQDQAAEPPGGADFFLASFDSGGHLGNWRHLDLHTGGRRGFNPWPSFSPDGSEIAYVTRDNLAGEPDLVLYDLSTGQERVLYRPGSVTRLNCQYAVHNPRVLCIEAKIGVKADLISVGAESGEVQRFGSFGEPFVTDTGYWVIQPSHDDQAVFLMKDSATGGGSIVRWDTATLRETVVATPSYTWEFDRPSPDERWLVRSIYRQGLAVRPISGGEWKSLVSVRGLAWPYVTTPVGNWVLYMCNDPSEKRALFRVPMAGGQPERVADSPREQLNGLWVSPDGRQVLTVSTNYEKYDLWVLENFVPPAKP
jgi:Tol biopolymer transport system component